MAQLVLSGITTLYRGSAAATGDIHVHGLGSVFTFLAAGTAGQTATIYGSIDGNIWAEITVLTVGAANEPDWTTEQCVFPFLKIEGNATTVQISRGQA